MYSLGATGEPDSGHNFVLPLVCALFLKQLLKVVRGNSAPQVDFTAFGPHWFANRPVLNQESHTDDHLFTPFILDESK